MKAWQYVCLTLLVLFSAVPGFAQEPSDPLGEIQTTLENLLSKVELQGQSTADLLSRLRKASRKAEALAAENARLGARATEPDAPLVTARERIAALEAPASPAQPPVARSVVPLEVRETAGIPRKAALVSSGVPLAEGDGVTDVSSLALLGPDGKLVPADFRPIGWWRSRKAPRGLQWVQVTFLADVAANATAIYKLLVGAPAGSNPAPTGTFAVRREGNVVTADTGAASFVVSPAGLFRSASLAGKTLLSAGETATTFNGQTDRLTDASVRRVELEYVGPLVAYVQVEAAFPALAFGGGKVSLLRRYEFRRGSGIVKVGERLAWEGTLNGTNWQTPDGGLNAVLGSLWAEKLALVVKGEGVTVLAERGKEPLRATAEAEVALRQKLRANRWDPGAKKAIPRSYEVLSGGNRAASGIEATGGLLAVTSPAGVVVAALRQMHRYEPQAIYARPGQLEIRPADDKHWLAYRQGAWVNLVVALLPPTAGAAELQGVWGELNRPLRALAAPEHYGIADVGPLPPRALPPALASYRKALRSISEQTLAHSSRVGLWGLMTWAGWPRMWGPDWDEVGPGTGGWDDLFRGFAATDYYSTSASSVRLALLTGEAEWLDELAVPAAQRMLHTQIMQCGPADTWFYCGQAPTGYAAYRSDFNSSHQYWENLYWYYWLTGDRLVVDALARGQKTMAPFLANQVLAGRNPHQHLMAMRFLGHAHPDETTGKYYSDTFDSYMLRAIRDQYIEGVYQGAPVAFWVDSTVRRAGTNRTPNLYALSIWDAENIWWYAKRTDSPEIRQKLAKIAATIVNLGPKVVGGDGTVAGKIARGFSFTWDGATGISGVAARESGGETLLYPGDTPGIATLLARAASIDPALAAKSRELVLYSINRLLRERLPMGKITGLGEVRLGAAVAAEANRQP